MKSELRSFAMEIAGPAAYAVFAEEKDAPLPDRLGRLATLTGEDAAAIRHAFGRRMFERFVALCPDLAPLSGDALDWLEYVEGHFLVELRALHPETRPPRLCCVRVSPSRLLIRYWSATPVSEMVEGMIEAALVHFSTRALVTRREAKDDAAIFEVALAKDA